MGQGRRRRQQIRAAGHVLIAKGRFGTLSPTRGRYQGRRPQESPVIRHVQEPEGAIVGMLPIARLSENDPIIGPPDIAPTANSAHSTALGLRRARRTPAARVRRVVGCPAKARKSPALSESLIPRERSRCCRPHLDNCGHASSRSRSPLGTAGHRGQNGSFVARNSRQLAARPKRIWKFNSEL